MIIINQTANKTDHQESIQTIHTIESTTNEYNTIKYFFENMESLYNYGLIDKEIVPYKIFSNAKNHFMKKPKITITNLKMTKASDTITHLVCGDQSVKSVYQIATSPSQEDIVL